MKTNLITHSFAFVIGSTLTLIVELIKNSWKM